MDAPPSVKREPGGATAGRRAGKLAGGMDAPPSVKKARSVPNRQQAKRRLQTLDSAPAARAYHTAAATSTGARRCDRRPEGRQARRGHGCPAERVVGGATAGRRAGKLAGGMDAPPSV